MRLGVLYAALPSVANSGLADLSPSLAYKELTPVEYYRQLNVRILFWREKSDDLNPESKIFPQVFIDRNEHCKHAHRDQRIRCGQRRPAHSASFEGIH